MILQIIPNPLCIEKKIVYRVITFREEWYEPRLIIQKSVHRLHFDKSIGAPHAILKIYRVYPYTIY